MQALVVQGDEKDNEESRAWRVPGRSPEQEEVPAGDRLCSLPATARAWRSCAASAGVGRAYGRGTGWGGCIRLVHTLDSIVNDSVAVSALHSIL